MHEEFVFHPPRYCMTQKFYFNNVLLCILILVSMRYFCDVKVWKSLKDLLCGNNLKINQEKKR